MTSLKASPAYSFLYVLYSVPANPQQRTTDPSPEHFYTFRRTAPYFKYHFCFSSFFFWPPAVSLRSNVRDGLNALISYIKLKKT